ncbi:YolD-like family protein [Aquibacillus saliphilus]|uniref:YolD-like family protein n=1 Tax=Aquibacillus saliphilus TaxID=1909422 RepID=UPI001CEFF642|nr:YolD-like family protein [Aquibacillus saliphilus]
MTKVNDRGNIKWTPFMMPEHIEMLNNYWESQKNIAKPILSEDHYEEMARTIEEAIEYLFVVDIQYYKNHRIKVIEGVIKRSVQHRLEIQTEDGIDYLDFTEILDVSIIK